MESSNCQMLEMQHRLEKLERQNRKLKHNGVVVLVIMCAVFIMGQSLPGTGIIEAEKFVLRDKNKVRRAELTMNEYGNPGLYLYKPLKGDLPSAVESLLIT